MGRDSVLGLATRYGLDGKGGPFRNRPYRRWVPPNFLYNGYRVSFPGVKQPGRGANHTPTSSAEIKERI
jgi:hypothetical protein